VHRVRFPYGRLDPDAGCNIGQVVTKVCIGIDGKDVFILRVPMPKQSGGWTENEKQFTSG
jgi:hypothetical protein